MKTIIEITNQASKVGHVTVVFSDDTQREYKIRYTEAGRRYIKVYGAVIYDFRGKAV